MICLYLTFIIFSIMWLLRKKNLLAVLMDGFAGTYEQERKKDTCESNTPLGQASVRFAYAELGLHYMHRVFDSRCGCRRNTGVSRLKSTFT